MHEWYLHIATATTVHVHQCLIGYTWKTFRAEITCQQTCTEETNNNTPPPTSTISSKVNVTRSRDLPDTCCAINREQKSPRHTKIRNNGTSFKVKRSSSLRLLMLRLKYLPNGNACELENWSLMEHALPTATASEVWLLHEGGGIPRRPHPAATQLVINCIVQKLYYNLAAISQNPTTSIHSQSQIPSTHVRNCRPRMHNILRPRAEIRKLEARWAESGGGVGIEADRGLQCPGWSHGRKRILVYFELGNRIWQQLFRLFA